MKWISRLFSRGGEVSLETASYAAVGDRPVQEDSIGVAENEKGLCCILCDGLGGHGMGDAASSLVVSVVKDRFLRNEADLADFLGQAFCAAQDSLMAEQKARRAQEKMKTTAAAMVTDRRKVYIGHVGDSRIYIFGRNGKWRRTGDHSIPQMLVMTREIKESEIRRHPDRNILLRVMGVEWEKPMYELMRPIDLSACDGFLLCSDGFWELIEETDMTEALHTSASAEEWLEKMIRIVSSHGSDRKMDNNSAIAVLCRR